MAADRAPGPGGAAPVWPGLVGGRYQPLTRPELERIHRTVLDVLEQIGIADPIPSMVELVTAAGGWLDADGRLHYPRSLVEDLIARAPRRFVLPGQDATHDLEVGGGRVHTGTAGAAPLIVDFETGLHRPTTTIDLYDIARLVDTLDHVHFYWRSVVARDLPTAEAIDLNTVYACMQGTTKHITTSFGTADGVRTAVAMLDLRLGGEGEFRKRPFCSIACTHVVPPLRFAADGCEAMEAAVRAGMPVGIVSSPLAGATSPVTLAGTIVQTMAEALGGLVFCQLIDPSSRAHLGTWPFLSDLRTGMMSAGSAENGLIVAGCAQMAGFYDLPGSVAAGMTDAKLPDAQSGSEKAATATLAANAGASLICEAAGMQASLLSTALEAYVIDDDMLAAVQRTVRGIEVTDETLAFDMINDVVHDEGHFLGHPETRRRMRRDFVYPAVGSREGPVAWEAEGRKDVRERARERVRAVLRSHYPDHISPDLDERIRAAFDIRLPREAMIPGTGRWP
jgi:trimethylamine--corrinoid protein Co-methyltransferase